MVKEKYRAQCRAGLADIAPPLLLLGLGLLPVINPTEPAIARILGFGRFLASSPAKERHHCSGEGAGMFLNNKLMLPDQILRSLF